MSSEVIIAIAVVVVIVIVVAVAMQSHDKHKHTDPNPGPKPGPNPNPMPIPTRTVTPFSGWKGHEYVVDIDTQTKIGWAGITSTDQTPILCPDATFVTGKCATDLASAGQICDSTAGCAGIIYNISDPLLPVAIPVMDTPVGVRLGTPTAYGGGAIFLTIPSSSETTGHMSVAPVAGSQYVGTNLTQQYSQTGPFGKYYNGTSTPIPNAMLDCITDNTLTPGTCTGVLVPVNTSPFQQKYNFAVGGNGQPPFYLSGIEYNGLAAGTPPQPYSNAISLTYASA